jgi:predicted ATPase with chaperone activity
MLLVPRRPQSSLRRDNICGRFKTNHRRPICWTFEEVRNDLLASGMLRDNIDFYKKQQEEALKVIDATAEKTRKQKCDDIEEAQAKLEERIEDARERTESLVLMADRDFIEQWCVKAASARDGSPTPR